MLRKHWPRSAEVKVVRLVHPGHPPDPEQRVKLLTNLPTERAKTGWTPRTSRHERTSRHADTTCSQDAQHATPLAHNPKPVDSSGPGRPDVSVPWWEGCAVLVVDEADASQVACG